ncbi:cysteine desulfurase family protein [Olivibacter ginsenosidimutans]|uniref:Cysteine desulfurase family protein n=1 Tax=Olivibacter ginsenosidimutans TaxID=1176537 RepID=A0ABP9BMD1_9SPHI
MRVYLDNAATTAIDEAVLQEMMVVMREEYGNPSSIHADGRKVRTLIEKARKKIASLLNASPAEIFFTSGGTEADNTAIRRGILDHKLTYAISSPLEHHAVLHTLQEMEREGQIRLDLLSVDGKGNVDIHQLEDLLKNGPRALVSLMHANNELGTKTPIDSVAALCTDYQALFHSDTVQTMGHFVHDLRNLNVSFLAGAAHKFHGPKGIGFLYINSAVKIKPFIYGGAQERNMRGGTENVYGIVGLAKALELAYTHMDEHRQHIQGLKDYMQQQLLSAIPDVRFNGETDPEKSLYTVLNVSFPAADMGDMLLFNLDIAGVSASGGSACSSGSNVGSHVLTAIGADPNRPSIRFSFSKFNTKEDIDFVVEKLKEICLEKV